VTARRLFAIALLAAGACAPGGDDDLGAAPTTIVPARDAGSTDAKAEGEAGSPLVEAATPGTVVSAEDAAGSDVAGDSGGSAGVGASGTDAGADADAGTMGGSSTIDFSIWQLQLPTGTGTSPTTVSPAELAAGFSDAYFYRAADGGQIFMDPATGVTTSGSQHCRTELRELTRDGIAAAWASSGTNRLTVSGKVRAVGGGTGGHVTVGQVFNDTDSIPLFELEYATKLGGFEGLYEETKGGGTTTNLAAPTAPNAPYTFELELSASVLTVRLNGNVVYMKTPSAALGAKRFYFKLGAYDQTATAGPPSTTPYTVVGADAVTVVHQ
jgi:Alginate lyase